MAGNSIYNLSYFSELKIIENSLFMYSTTNCVILIPKYFYYLFYINHVNNTTTAPFLNDNWKILESIVYVYYIYLPSMNPSGYTNNAIEIMSVNLVTFQIAVVSLNLL